MLLHYKRNSTLTIQRNKTKSVNHKPKQNENNKKNQLCSCACDDNCNTDVYCFLQKGKFK